MGGGGMSTGERMRDGHTGGGEDGGRPELGKVSSISLELPPARLFGGRCRRCVFGRS